MSCDVGEVIESLENEQSRALDWRMWSYVPCIVRITYVIRNLKSRRLRWVGHVARMEQSRNVYRVLVGKPEGKRPLTRAKRRWEDNTEMDFEGGGF